MKLFLYDPRLHLKTETTFQEAASIAGISVRAVYICKCTKRKLKGTGCYIVDETVTHLQFRAWYESEKYPDEQFKPAIDEPRLLVSNYGRVKRVDLKRERFLLPTHSTGSSGEAPQIRVVWKKGVKRSYYQLARLVAGAFLGACPPDKVVVHKNGMRNDCHAANLVYMSFAEYGKSRYCRKGRKRVVRIDPDTNQIIEEYRSVAEAGKRSHISRQCVSMVCNHGGTTGGMRFMFEKDYLEKYGEIGGEEYAR